MYDENFCLMISSGTILNFEDVSGCPVVNRRHEMRQEFENFDGNIFAVYYISS